jgi:hypothetical protein
MATGGSIKTVNLGSGCVDEPDTSGIVHYGHEGRFLPISPELQHLQTIHWAPGSPLEWNKTLEDSGTIDTGRDAR